MAEAKKDKKHTEHKPGLSFGIEIILFIIAIFIIWVLTGGLKKTTEEKPFITPLNDPINPGVKYGPKDLKPNSNYYQQSTDTKYEPTDTVN